MSRDGENTMTADATGTEKENEQELQKSGKFQAK